MTTTNEDHCPADPRPSRGKVKQAVATARRQTGQAVTRGGEYLRERPATSLLSAFAFGVAVGVVIAGVSRPEPLSKLLATDLRDRLKDLLGGAAAHLRGPLGRASSSMSDGALLLSDSISHARERVAAAGKKAPWW